MLKDIDSVFAGTKILCTLGPATAGKDMIIKLLKEGMDGIRLNFSHGDYDFFRKVFGDIAEAKEESGLPAAVLVDLRGPKIRIGEVEGGSVYLEEGETIELTVDQITGTKERVFISYLNLPAEAEIGDIVLIDDGLIRLKITEKRKRSVICEVIIGGELKSRKGVNLPGMKLSTPSVSGKDIRDLEFALQFDINYIALSFVRKPEDIITLRKQLEERGYNIPLIAKIEKREAIERFDDILEVADGIMVARGDLGVEMEPDEVPIVQKLIIHKCNEVGKPVITATQMLESMVHNPIPTRAEASDVANAVWDGTDVVMLSAETSVGSYPVKAVKTMNNILRRAERHRHNTKSVLYKPCSGFEEMLFDSVNRGVADISRHVNAKAIIVFTIGGRTAESLSKFRPQAKIIAFSKSKTTADSLSLRWGIIPYYCTEIEDEIASIERAKQIVVQSEMVEKGDVLLFTAGAPYSEKGRMNLLRLDVV